MYKKDACIKLEHLLENSFGIVTLNQLLIESFQETGYLIFKRYEETVPLTVLSESVHNQKEITENIAIHQKMIPIFGF